jgi:mRNA-degrading endonuclease RelE of RelBE toxin-antitoxin system
VFGHAEHNIVAALVWKRDAAKAMLRIEPRRAAAIRAAMQAIGADPPPRGRHRNVVALAGVPDGYRLRVGDWRVSFIVAHAGDEIEVFEVAARGSAYRW